MIYGKIPVLFLSAISSERRGSINSTIAEYILEHLDEVKGMGILELAQSCYVSASSITRFCRDIGFNTYAELRDVLESSQLEFQKISSEESPKSRIADTTKIITNSINAVSGDIDITKLHKLCSELTSYREVAAFGLLKAQAAAVSLQCDLMMQGKQIYTNISYPQQIEYIGSVGSDGLVIIFSCTGSYFEYQDFRSMSRAFMAPRIWMISGEERNWPSFVDEVLIYPYKGEQAGHPYQLLTVASLIAQEYANTNQL